MRFSALVHLSRATLEMSEAESLVVFGSASLLASFPDLGNEAGRPIEAAFVADIIPFPFAEDLGQMLHEAFGDGRKFHQHFGYHANIIRPKIVETFPAGWEERVVSLEGVERVKCLDPHDMAAAKCRMARPKDAKQLEWLAKRGFIDLETVRIRLR